jgi:hypothetical protein
VDHRFSGEIESHLLRAHHGDKAVAEIFGKVEATRNVRGVSGKELAAALARRGVSVDLEKKT